MKLSAILSILLLPALAHGGEAAAPALSPVKTWAELRTLKPVIQESAEAWAKRFDLNVHLSAQPVNIRIGIDRLKAAPGEGVLLYCLAENEDHMGPIMDLGLFEVDVIPPGVQSAKEDSRARGTLAQKAEPRVGELFLKTVPLKERGTYLIRVTLLEKHGVPPTLVSETKIEVNGDTVQPWFPLDFAEGKVVDSDESKKSGALSAEATISDLRSSLPSLTDLGSGESICLAEWPPDKAPLPQLIPDETKPTLQLARKRATFTVTFPAAAGSSFIPAEEWLARLWINGKPFIPQALKEEHLSDAQAAGEVLAIKEIHFQLTLDPEVLPIKPGDRISLQLLHCPYGYVSFNAQGIETLKAKRQYERAAEVFVPVLSQISNRLDYTYRRPTKP